ncbi:TetR/AcrR family transcriptional regulator [Streptomyces lasiicapitis]|uniref:TetR family transcriptional regulator n=1 Tax=Streptomyces lasiicapitis TaxID=1923961 RepID=A0ABQ2MJV3_9ACTN|nr:TetR/AcrR family transcriptional regulator [Streptomyces lasiicapitis]GGO53879.1 TetR family transcriptional regulator [Streptomyces lasiicapitis]
MRTLEFRIDHTDEALERAMLVFWEHGYEGASLATLTEAMGISTTSMYAAFGNKEELFRKALERYTEGPSAYLDRALREPTALGTATAILAGTIRTTTSPARPQGCMGVQSALAVGDSGQAVRDLLAAWRNNGCCRLRQRFQEAVDDGDLPPQADPALLARYVTTLAFGIAVQAASDVSRTELQATADAALRNWPPC